MTSATPRPPLTREAVIVAARSLIEDEGLDAVSLRRLAQRLGVTAPALYAYVSDKDDLLRSVTADELGALVGSFERKDGESPLDAIRRFCHQYVDYAIAHPALYKTLFQHPPWAEPGDFGEFGLPLAVAQFAVPYQAVVEAIEDGLLRDTHPLLVALALWTMAHGLAGVLLQGIPGHGHEELRRQFVDLVIDTAIAGLR